MRATYRRSILLSVLLCTAAALFWVRSPEPVVARRHRRMVVLDERSAPALRRPEFLRVLFIGNSFTNFNGGQALIVQRLTTSAATRPARLPIFDQSTSFGATLEWHWKHGDARQRIAEGNWDFVVLQDHSEQPLLMSEDFFKYAKLLDGEIRKVGARTVLFMTWSKENEPQNGPVIAEAYERLAHEMGADVVPVGRAFMAARDRLTLYTGDGKHPTPAGSYLAGCCFYRYLYRRPSLGLSGTVADDLGEKWINLSNEEARVLQSIADKLEEHR